jgi:D-alanyl-D-alanine carboxypeptidase/D-alanyl-D-alanine-endopeptidase (penicillin-binding protein 4)
MWIIVQYLSSFYGLKAITGDIVLDDSFFDTASIGPCFIEDSLASNPYAAPVGALCANFNTVELCVRPGEVESQVAAEIFPKLPSIDLVVRAKTTAHRKGSGISVESQQETDRTRMIITGSLAKDAQPYFVLRKVRQTWRHFGSIFKMFLDEKGVVVKGKIRRGAVPQSVAAGKPLYTWESPPLWEVVADMMKFSTNLSAEMLFKTFSALRDSGGGSWEKSSDMMQAWWKEKGLPGSPVLKNGSGMGDCNRFSVTQLAALLTFVWGQKTYLPEYLNAFPVAGNDGTLRSRFKDSRFKTHVRGKTGTLNDLGVYTIAGYALMPKADYVFVILFNHMGSKYPYQHWEMQQKILEMLIPE